MWHVSVEWSAPPMTDEDCIDFIEKLGDLRPGITIDDWEHARGKSDEVTYSGVLNVTAETVREAARIGLDRVEGHTGIRAHGVEVVNEDRMRLDLTRPAIPELVGHAEIAELLGVSRQRAAQLASRPDFPPAVMTLKAGPLRVRQDVEKWIPTWTRRPGRPPRQTE